MNFTIGCDIEKISRFEDKLQNQIFLNEIFTAKEQEYCLSKGRPAQHFAARFCGKEAVVKALHSADIKGIYYKDIEITNDQDGIPNVFVSKLSSENIKIKITLSHCKDYATANAMVIRE